MHSTVVESHPSKGEGWGTLVSFSADIFWPTSVRPDGQKLMADNCLFFHIPIQKEFWHN
jgi:hypothetical protein